MKSFHNLSRRFAAIILPLGLMLSQPLSAQSAQEQQAQDPPKLSLEQKTAVRCVAAFAIIAGGQDRGNEAAKAYPPLDTRGKEFFVRTAAQLMDDLGVSREVVAELVAKEAQALWDENKVEAVMPGCLLLLDASGV